MCALCWPCLPLWTIALHQCFFFQIPEVGALVRILNINWH
jgi:hypothetical protein